MGLELLEEEEEHALSLPVPRPHTLGKGHGNPQPGGHCAEATKPAGTWTQMPQPQDDKKCPSVVEAIKPGYAVIAASGN